MFESCQARHLKKLNRELAQLGRALDLGSRGQEFESLTPDHWKIFTLRGVFSCSGRDEPLPLLILLLKAKVFVL